MAVVFIIAQKDFRDEEFFDTRAVLEQDGIEVKIAAPEEKTACGKLGLMVEPDLAINEIVVGRFDAIVFIGGPGAMDFINNESVHNLARAFFQANKLVAAICAGPAILAKAGLLKDKNVTAHISALEYLQVAGAVITENDVEKDGNLITASGPAVSSLFGQAIADYLKAR